MFLLFRNAFDLPLNVLFWLSLSTFAPWLFFTIYGPALPGFVFSRGVSNE